MIKFFISFSFFVSSFSYAAPAVSERQIAKVNVISARLRLIERTTDSSQYAIRVVAEYPNSCFAPNVNRIPNRIVFHTDTVENSNRINVQVFELPFERECPEIFEPVNVTFELRSIVSDARQVPRVIVNGVRAR